jgi:RHS repeat-associated protein
VPVLFASSYAGFKNVYMYASSVSGPVSGWQDKGDWDPLCTFDLTPASATLGSPAGSFQISVTTSSWCSWTAPASSAFLTLSSGGGTTGSGSVTYAYGSHTGDPRSTQVTMAGTPVSVMQTGTVPMAGEQVLYYHTDALGSVRMLTDAAGDIYPNAQTRMDYTPWGVLFPSTLAVGERRLFTGQERDSEALDYFGARRYAASTARFTSPDPITITRGRLLRPDRLNLYVYAHNNPLSFVDPDGLDVELPSAPLDRERVLSYFQDIVGPEAAALLVVYSVNYVEEGRSTTRYFLGIKDTILEFMIINTYANDLARLVSSPNTVKIVLDPDPNSPPFGGWADDRHAPNVEVRLDITDLPMVDRALGQGVPRNIFGFPVLFSAFENGRQRPLTPTILLWHELGHAWAIMNGVSDRNVIGDIGVYWENRMRRRVYGPLGDNNARRIRH